MRLRIDRLQTPKFEPDTDGVRFGWHRGDHLIIEVAALAEPATLLVEANRRHDQEIAKGRLSVASFCRLLL